MKRSLLYAVVAGSLSVGAALPVTAQDQQQDRLQTQQQQQTQAQTQERVYGWQLMSNEERQAYQAKMRSLQTPEEREQFRLEHHRQMQERAKQMGVQLPDEPMQPGTGRGMGPGGGGMGPGGGGMGPGMGGGMGPGGGRR